MPSPLQTPDMQSAPSKHGLPTAAALQVPATVDQSPGALLMVQLLLVQSELR